MWSDDIVVYEIYVRSFQDSNGDGIGDLRGVSSRLEHIATLGAGAIWLSPIFQSPNADFGYDVSDYLAVEPALGTLRDFDQLVREAHALDLRVLLDFVPCHTSIQHRWFREHPDYYFWADSPPNNWRAAFGGSAWERDLATGRYYLHSFYPEQADLNWRNHQLRQEMASTLRFWLDRGVDGFRLDALDGLLKDQQLRDDPPAPGPPPFPLHSEHAELLHIHSRNAPDTRDALRAIRDAVGEAVLVGEVFLPGSELGPYLESLDAAFAFEVFFAGDADALAGAIGSAIAAGRPGWVLSNHDFSRLGSRLGPDNVRAATVLLLSLPGPAFMFQGDELGMLDGPIAAISHDRHGRDAFRRPPQWDSSSGGGFSSAAPWLPVGDGVTPSVAVQQRDVSSVLALVRRMIALRGQLDGPVELIPSPPETIVVARGGHVIATNFGAQQRHTPETGVHLLTPVIEARPGDGADLGLIPAHGGWIATTT
jgi:alpha-glucosidase